MLDVSYSAKFKKDIKRLRRQGKNLAKIDAVILSLRKREVLPARFHDHDLIGDYKDHRECHIAPDWLLIYKIDEGELILTAVRTGSHAELFDL